jgi:hypothetical protein
MYATYREQWTYESGLMLQATGAKPSRDQQVGTPRRTLCWFRLWWGVGYRTRLLKAFMWFAPYWQTRQGTEHVSTIPAFASREIKHQITWSLLLIWLFRLSHSFKSSLFYFLLLYI